MNKTKNLFLMICCIILIPLRRPLHCAIAIAPLLFSICLYGAFEDISIGGRPTALGGAYTAMSEDVYGIYYNPAGIARAPRAEFGGQYSKLYIGLTYDSDLSNSFTGIILPVKFKNDFGTVGVGWLRFALSNLYQENSIILSYGIQGVGVRGLSVGTNMKLLTLSYGEDGYTRNAVCNDGNLINAGGQRDTFFDKGYSKSAFDMDFGLKYNFAKNYAAGVKLENLLGANISLVNDPDVTLARKIKIGVSHEGKNYILTSDVSGDSKTSTIRTMLGGERFFDFGGAIRAGIGLGTNEWANATIGVGYKTDGLSFDYSLLWTLVGIKNTYGSHRVSVNLRFGPVIRLPETESALTLKLAQEITARKELEEKYKLSEIELARAREEIKQLRAQIEGLLKRPGAPVVAPKVIPEPAPAKPLPKEKVPVEPVKVEIPTDLEQLKAAYVKEFNQYQKDAAKLDLKKRLLIIEGIVSRYSGKIKITEAVDEQMILKNELAAQTKFYKDALGYYRRLVRQGISVEERRDILNRMIKKYEALGVDVSEAKEELKQIK